MQVDFLCLLDYFFLSNSLFKEQYKLIPPHETLLIPTGIASSCSPEYCFILKERSSTGIRRIAQRSGVIDSGYRGELIIPITNVHEDLLCIAKENAKIPDLNCRVHPHSKAIRQAFVVNVPRIKTAELSYDELKCIGSMCGENGFGSSGK
jgi:DUTP diphosphatase